jgi:DnaJ-domain-containing protein 1
MIGRLFTIARAYLTTAGAAPRHRPDEPAFDAGSADAAPPRDERGGTLPRHVLEDLAVFELGANATLDDVKRAHRREMKKYHPDRFNRHREKERAANELATIYNEAYARLVRHFAGA